MLSIHKPSMGWIKKNFAGEILKDIYTNKTPLRSSGMYSQLNGAYKPSYEDTYI